MSRFRPWPWCRSCRMGPPLGASPPMRMSASWYRSAGIGRIQGCHAKHREAQGELPSGRMAMPIVRLGITRLAPCSPASRTLRAASGGGLRPPLTPAPHSAHRSLRSGRGNRRLNRTEKLQCNDELALDREGPIQERKSEVPSANLMLTSRYGRHLRVMRPARGGMRCAFPAYFCNTLNRTANSPNFPR